MSSPTTTHRTSPAVRGVRSLTAALAGALVFTVAPALSTSLVSSATAEEKLPPGRDLVPYTVKPGDTASGLAVKHHAWTRELISHNNLGSNPHLRVGQKITIPVVTSAVPQTKSESKNSKSKRTKRSDRKLISYTVKPGDTASSLAKEHHAWTRELITRNSLGSNARLRVGQKITIPVVTSAVPKKSSSSKTSGPSRATVRKVIISTSRKHGVDPYLALAVSWQEAGWQMHHVSSANAIGAMQVLPATGTWMEGYAGHKLNLRDVHDNVTAGVLLLKVLDQQTSTTTNQIAAYYQGIGAVRRHGVYTQSKPYVANVLALRNSLKNGWTPA